MRSERRTEAGMTLVEVLVALAVLGLAIAGITSSLGGASIASAAHRRTVTADTVVRSYAEAIKEKILSANGYVDCAGARTYSDTNVGFVTPAGFVVDQAQPTYQKLTPTEVFTASCPSDGGAQSMRLTASSVNGADIETLDIIVRRP